MLCFAPGLFGFCSTLPCDWLVKKTRVTLSNNQMQNLIQSRPGYFRFSATQTIDLYLLWAPSVTLWVIPLFWLTAVSTLVFALHTQLKSVLKAHKFFLLKSVFRVGNVTASSSLTLPCDVSWTHPRSIYIGKHVPPHWLLHRYHHHCLRLQIPWKFQASRYHRTIRARSVTAKK